MYITGALVMDRLSESPISSGGFHSHHPIMAFYSSSTSKYFYLHCVPITFSALMLMISLNSENMLVDKAQSAARLLLFR